MQLNITGMENLGSANPIPPPIKPNELIPRFSDAGYKITQDWFTKNLIVWNPIIDAEKPIRILEIGSFEGLSTIYLIERCGAFGNVEIHCIDTWEGGVEHESLNFTEIEERFDHNVRVACEKESNPVKVIKHKGRSVVELAKLIAAGEPKFDLIYVDGSHLAPDVLTDGVLAFELLKLNGTLIFDDYNNPNPVTPEFPKMGIDCFATPFQKKIGKIRFVDESGENIENERRSMYQLYLKKVAE